MSVRIGNRAGSRVIQSAQLAAFTEIFPAPRPFIWARGSVPWTSPAPTAFCQQGVRPTPYIIDHITDSQGQPRFRITRASRTVYSQRAANITSSILQQVCKPGGTAGKITALGFKSPAAAKPEPRIIIRPVRRIYVNLTCSVWVGFDSSIN
ncbi:MAG: hypothetical protein ACLSUW_04260 [Akkermansia sp.]